MPNEKIYRSVPTFEIVGSKDGPLEHVETGAHTEMLSVNWYPDQSVQVGIDLGRPFQFAGESMPSTSLWMDLSRHEINRLIKALRRARDAAYGRDE